MGNLDQQSIVRFQIFKGYFFSFSGSIPLDPSLAQSLEDGQAFIDLFPNSPTLNAVNVITSKLLQMESIEDQWLKEQCIFFKEYVAFIRLEKCDWEGQVRNCWYLLSMSVSISQISDDLRTNSQNSNVERNDGQQRWGELTVWAGHWKWWRIGSLLHVNVQCTWLF